jgi:hypothetical protein
MMTACIALASLEHERLDEGRVMFIVYKGWISNTSTIIVIVVTAVWSRSRNSSNRPR